MRTKLSFLKSLLYFGFACRKDKQLQMKEKAMARFERPLDIRSFVSMYTNLSLLLKVIFTEQQAILFQHHRARAISIKSSKNNGEYDDSSANEDQQPELSLEINGNNVETLENLTSKLLGHSQLTRLDRQLLVGIFGNKNKSSKAKEGNYKDEAGSLNQL